MAVASRSALSGFGPRAATLGGQGTHGVNTQVGSPRYGQSYSAIPVAGGTMHLYADGTKQVVKAGAPTPTSQPAPPALNPTAPTDTTGQATPGDYRDSVYFQSVAGAQQQHDDALAANQGQAASNLAARQAALDALAQKQPRDTQSVQERYNDQGLFYSGHAGQALNDLAAKYLASRNQANSQYTAAETAREAARKAIENGLTMAQAAAAAAAADRGIARDQTLAGNDQLAPDLPVDVPTPDQITGAPTPPIGHPAPKTFIKNGKFYRDYGDGRGPIYVRPATH